MSLETQFVQALSGLLYASATAGIRVITPKIKGFLEYHITAKKMTVAYDVLNGLSRISESVVSDFNQRVVNDVKGKGGWTPQLAQQVKRDATSAIKSQGSPFIKLLEKTLGDVEPLIATLIEQTVAKAKK